LTIEKDYWDQRYAEGGDSGWCSVGKLREWRHKIVSKNTSLKNKSILDVGCGDLRFWQGFKHQDYTGLDISSVIITKNFNNRPEWKFLCVDASKVELTRKYDVVFCFEMLFHIMSEEAFIGILKNLNRWTGEMLFISCWSKRPDPFVHEHYQAHYQLEDYLQYLPDLQLKNRYTNKKGLRALFVFKRKEGTH